MLTLDAARNTATNSDYIPFAADIEADIRLTQRAMREIDDEGVSGQTLKGWLDAFSHLAAKYINRAVPCAASSWRMRRLKEARNSARRLSRWAGSPPRCISLGSIFMASPLRSVRS
ncbi:hypothetical protein [Rhizobium sp. P44RR-XXIV]|uniref:hypothetical protein n=1 Tax=Rhizobium sp. P44RR-XXIV TaxID=1921145 RepID=UPI0010AA9E9A|nr:hypothetical protein [Rhizobium sp. P44RR-XXIV]TIX93584.1 hypothetical protein BSK43_000215 [Rhizobium sp. P44RR-XXIV]